MQPYMYKQGAYMHSPDPFAAATSPLLVLDTPSTCRFLQRVQSFRCAERFRLVCISVSHVLSCACCVLHGHLHGFVPLSIPSCWAAVPWVCSCSVQRYALFVCSSWAACLLRRGWVAIGCQVPMQVQVVWR